MKLDRNTNRDGKGKYALIKLREALVEMEGGPDYAIVSPQSAIDFGDTPETEFFVIRLKDAYAYEALRSYAAAALSDGHHEWALEINDLAERAKSHPSKKRPD